MKVHKEDLSLTVTLNKQEIIWLKNQSQNFQGTEDNLESEEDKVIRKDFFTTMMVALGYELQSDGTLRR